MQPAIARQLTKAFSPSVLESLAETGDVRLLDKFLPKDFVASVSERCSVGEILDAAYDQLRYQYPSDYVLRNALIAKRLKSRHGVSYARCLQEVRLGSSKADLIVLHRGQSTVYEFKSKYDDVSRLSSQVQDYMQSCDRTFVVTDEKHVNKVLNKTPREVGIMMLTKRYTFKERRNATDTSKSINHGLIFDTLRKSEYLRIIESQYGVIPSVPNTQIRTTCKDMFCQLPTATARSAFVAALNGRSKYLNDCRSAESIPHSLHAVLNTTGFPKSLINGLMDALQKPYRG